MFGSGLASSQKVPKLDWGELTARRLVGDVQNEGVIAFTAQKPSVAVFAVVNLSSVAYHLAPPLIHRIAAHDPSKGRTGKPMESSWIKRAGVFCFIGLRGLW